MEDSDEDILPVSQTRKTVKRKLPLSSIPSITKTVGMYESVHIENSNVDLHDKYILDTHIASVFAESVGSNLKKLLSELAENYETTGKGQRNSEGVMLYIVDIIFNHLNKSANDKKCTVKELSAEYCFDILKQDMKYEDNPKTNETDKSEGMLFEELNPPTPKQTKINKRNAIPVRHSDKIILDPYNHTVLKFVCNLIKHLQSEDEIDEVELVQRITNTFVDMPVTQNMDTNCEQFGNDVNDETEGFMPVIPLEIVWYLHKEDIIPLDMYLNQFLDKSVKPIEFIEALIILINTAVGVNKMLHEEILTDFIQLLIMWSQITQDRTLDNRVLMKFSLQLLLQLLAYNIVDNILEMPNTTNQKPSMNGLLKWILLNSILTTDCIKSCFGDQLIAMMSYYTVYKVNYVFQNQEQWSLDKMPANFGKIIKTLMEPFDINEVLDLMIKVVERHEVNWKILLCIISAVLQQFIGATIPIKNLIKTFLSQSFTNCTNDGLITGILIARQASFEGVQKFPCYAEWFGNTFQNEQKSAANTNKTFKILVSFLIDITPFETITGIRAHISRTPSIPKNSKSCREAWDDYVSLAKTKLKDLINTKGNSTKFEDVNDEVEAAVNHFDLTGNISTSLYDTIAFQRTVFKNKFLPVLLQQRILPTTPDAKMNLINTLHTGGKIPTLRYEEYIENCKKLLESSKQDLDVEIVHVETVDVDVSTLSNTTHEGFKSSLTLVEDVIVALASEDDNESILIVFEQVVSKINEILGSDEEDTESHLLAGFTTEDVTNCKSRKHKEVVTSLLHTLYHCLENTEQRPFPKWVDEFLIQLIKPYLQLQKAMYAVLWNTLQDNYTNTGSKMSDEQIHSLSIVIFKLGCLKDVLLPIIVQTEEIIPFVDFVTSFTMSNKQEMEFSLRLCYFYLKEVSVHYAHVFICDNLVKKYLFLYQRLTWMKNYLTYELEKEILKPFVLSLKDWFTMEYKIKGSDDLFNDVMDRQNYMFFRVKKLISTGMHDLTFILSILLEVLLEYDDFILVPVNSRLNLINLLQQLSCIDITDTDPHSTWLYQQWITIVGNSGKEKQQSRDLQFFRIFTCLPPWLLFTNNTSIEVSQEHLKTMTTFINNRLRNVLNEGITLSKLATTTILSGLSQSLKDQVAIEAFIEKIPCLNVGSLVYADEVNTISDNKKFQCIRDWEKYNRFIRDEIHFSELLANIKQWRIAVLFASTIYEANPELCDVLLPQFNFDVLSYLLVFLLLQFASKKCTRGIKSYELDEKSDITYQWIHKIVRIKPRLIHVFKSPLLKKSVICLSTPQHICNYIPLVSMELLVNLAEKNRQSFYPISDLVMQICHDIESNWKDMKKTKKLYDVYSDKSLSLLKDRLIKALKCP